MLFWQYYSAKLKKKSVGGEGKERGIPLFVVHEVGLNCLLPFQFQAEDYRILFKLFSIIFLLLGKMCIFKLYLILVFSCCDAQFYIE
jgi:hypothetical protein